LVSNNLIFNKNMADNYLEKKFEEYKLKKNQSSQKKRSNTLSLNDLMLKDRSHRIYNMDYLVSREELREIVSVNSKIGNTLNRQLLRFKLITGEDALSLGKRTNLKFPPNAFIVICSPEPINKWTYLDAGISCEAMTLKATEMGLNGIVVGSFNEEDMKEFLHIELSPVIMVGIGKGIQKIHLTPVHADEPHKYYEKEDRHIVPKIMVDDLIF